MAPDECRVCNMRSARYIGRLRAASMRDVYLIKSLAHAAKLPVAFETGEILTPKDLITQSGLSRGAQNVDHVDPNDPMMGFAADLT
jgi:hypothetical protein